MKTQSFFYFTVLSLLLMLSCKSNENSFDATGTFEAEETIISSEVAGILEEFNVEEGQILKPGQYLGYIDSTQLYLKKLQLLAQIRAIESKQPNVMIQTAALKEQLKNLKNEQNRIQNLFNDGAATGKQSDDIAAQVELVEKQLAAQQSTLQTMVDGIYKETQPLQFQIEQINEQLQSCKLYNPMEGTVLLKYAEPKEMTAPSKPLYKIADLNELTLRAYVSGDQLKKLKIGQKVKVFTDNGKNEMDQDEGILTRISEKAEFTPKTIQTKNERANMVYAIKIKVRNKGDYKIGMYAEVTF
ncbi:MAG: efflux RND transporter periplasmic adaptor subunit [Flavobacteriales bacterium]|nr:efflux RND transporter periplasmic adaptor subunit [Flavobacteriales bacterium]